ncbi:DUF5928 domain-containing protein [Jannaschia sp. W003]|uniref:DUF5928 domain-containing protein n=1 Tax=Jannaschia sp. W003 TaxID=2867012 RepID=UPI0021A30537|nr:DUF5928 domain-containing protein [Jannaschia sp. W003]UWQ22306.1 DUF5928 domain-containing protein [Jannaschia sp. W003]
MARIAFILLCHADPEAIVAQARTLTAAGDCVAIHFDGRAPAADFARIEAELADEPGVALVRRRVKCGWGEWSLVRATMAAMQLALEAFPRATHLHAISGDCFPVKSAPHAHAFLDAEDVDYVESVDFFASDWIKTGMKEERLLYRHLFNERRRKRLFYAALAVQKRLGLQRAVPEDLEMMIGSQWWCLRRATAEAILRFAAERADVVRFFSTTWIPDETFFQTLVRHLVPRAEIRSRTLTFLMFTDYGMPATFHDDHHDFLLGQDYLFARKISPEAWELKARLSRLWTSDRRDFPVAGDGRRLFSFLTGRGRVGRRFAQRAWEREGTLGRDSELLVLVCKKYHVAKRLAQSIREHTALPVIDYLFDEEHTAMPDLGGIESTLAKRHRHRRALLRMLFRQTGSRRLAICLDPAQFDLLRDLSADRNVTRVLLLECDYDEAYLRGHAARIGLIGERTPEDTVARVLPTLAQDVAYETDRVREARLPHVHRIDPRQDEAARAAVLARALDCDEAAALAVARTPYLFDD